ncbi:serine hydrolase domain-containing protein [Actinomadura terrae]|uniref:serine hydrolase domain-containing protein n=1 Tax=Actinomadura terrae TaxID=604353 RepID=UPI001FA6E67B|nr:serine hydrolase domain-containing protein [Actinomadura terrae]
MAYGNVRPLRRAGLAAGVALVMLVPAGLASAATPARTKARTGTGAGTGIGNVQEAMEEAARTPGVVGVVGAAYVDGRLAGQGSGGSRLLGGKGGRIPPGARFRVGSQTKEMVATVVLQLVRDGRLGVDDKLADLLPVVVEKDLVARAGEVTVRQMIRHTSGIPDWYAAKPNPDGSEGEEPSFDVFDFTTTYSPLDIVGWSRGRPRTGEPGERYSYSNTNYTLLGMIIERVTGRDLATVMHEHLFGPLGMTGTYLPMRPPEGIRGPHGHGYYPDAEGRLRDVDRFNASIAGAAGGVVSTAHDMSAYKRAFVQGRLLPPELQRILTDRLPGAAPAPGAVAAAPAVRAARAAGGDLCGTFMVMGGTTAGYLAMTFYSEDGRRQFAVSVTVSGKDVSKAGEAAGRAMERVFCPAS